MEKQILYHGSNVVVEHPLVNVSNSQNFKRTHIMTVDINTLTYDSFIQKIKTIRTYRSNANKEYKVVKANKTTLVLRDQRTKTDFEGPAIQIFYAMQDLGIENCTVPNMRKYVGTNAAPASAALIYWAFGRGQVHAEIKKISDLVFKKIKKQLK